MPALPLILLLWLATCTHSPLSALSLDQALQLAYHNNLELKRQEEELIPARQAYRHRWLQLTPTLNLTAEQARNESFQQTFNLNTLSQELEPVAVDAYSLMLTLQQPLLQFDLYAQISGRTIDYQIAETQLKQKTLEIYQTTAQAYYRLCQQEQLITLARAQLQTASEALQQMQARHQQGLVATPDLYPYQRRRLQAERTIAQATRTFTQQSQELLTLMGMPQQTLTSLHLPPIPSTPIDTQQLHAQAQQRNITLNLLRLQAKQARNRYQQVARRHLPSLNLTGQYGYQDADRFSTEREDPHEPPTHVLVLGRV